MALTAAGKSQDWPALPTLVPIEGRPHSGLPAAGSNSGRAERGRFPGLPLDRGRAEAVAAGDVLQPARSRGRELVRPASRHRVWGGRRVRILAQDLIGLGAGGLLLFPRPQAVDGADAPPDDSTNHLPKFLRG